MTSFSRSTVTIVLLISFLLFVLILLGLYFIYRQYKKNNHFEEKALLNSIQPQTIEEQEKQATDPESRVRSSLFYKMMEARYTNPTFDPSFLTLPQTRSPLSSTSGSSIDLSMAGTNDTESENGDQGCHHEPGIPAQIELTINYFSTTSTLHVNVIKVSNLKLSTESSAYVKLTLKSSATKLSKARRMRTKLVKSSSCPIFDEEFSFDAISPRDLRDLKLKVAVYIRKSFASKQLVGDIYIPLSRPDLQPDTLIGIKENLSMASPVTGRRGPIIMAGSLGFLKVDLQYNNESQRIKIMVRKGENLPLGSPAFQLLGSPEHRIIVSLMRNQEVVAFKETRRVHGVNPNFNQVYLFYLDLDVDSNGEVKKSTLDEYWIQLLLIRGRFEAKDGVVGNVLIGNGTTLLGSQHWNQVLASPMSEISKWHPVSHLQV